MKAKITSSDKKESVILKKLENVKDETPENPQWVCYVKIKSSGEESNEKWDYF